MANVAKTASAFSKIKTIQTIHGIIPEIGILPHFKSDYYISVNEHIIEYLKNKNKINISKVSLIRSGVEVYTRDSIIVESPLKILAASRLVEEKGLDVYIKAIALLPESYRKNNDFYLAGAGDLEKELNSLNESLNQPVKFLGELTDLHKHLMENHIFVFPSKSDAEGFPMVVVEAGLASNLVISTNFRGYESILKNGSNSIIFDCGDEANLANVLKNAIDRFDDYTQLRQQIRLDCKEKFSPEKNADLLVKLYQNCLS